MDLIKIFPRTFSLYSAIEAEALRKSFFKDWESEQLHFFPMFLRQQQYPESVVEAADYEFQIYFLSQADVVPNKSRGSHFQLNSSSQFLRIQAASPVLEKKPGLYVIWKSSHGLQERILNLQEAAFLDRLREDLPVYQAELDATGLEIANQFLRVGLIFRDLITSQGPLRSSDLPESEYN